MKHVSIKVLSTVLLLASVLALVPGQLNAQADRRLERPGAARTGEKRLALVIGNGAYLKASRLDNPVNDANDMAAALTGLGFEVVKGTDAGLVQMRRLIREFGQKLAAQKGVGLFFFAGHGVEVRGRNFLIPVDADIASEVETEDYAVDVTSVLRQMEDAGNGFNIVILDACRNNPFARGWNRSGDAGGLANVLAPTGTYIAYAAAPGTTASDGRGTRNGVFTGALLRNLRKPNLKLEEVFKSTREEVMTATANKQVPWDSSSIKGDFYFRLDANAVRTNPDTAPASDDRVEQEYWEAVKGSTRAADFEGYLKEYPNGRYAAVARVRIGQLGAKTETKPETVPPTPSGAVAAGTVRKTPAGIELVWIPPGEFLMGSENGDSDEKPVRKVTIREGFWMGRNEVTQGQWQSVMGTNPSSFKDCGTNCPVEQVSWNDAKDFIARLNARNDGWVYSLPSEAEWEYAARAGTRGDRYGNLDDIAWYDNNSGGKTRPVGGKQPNAFGLYDTMGNVWEWVEDIYSADYSGLASDGSANTTRGDASLRVLRGGSWDNRGFANVARSAYRLRGSPSARTYNNGFRVAARPR